MFASYPIYFVIGRDVISTSADFTSHIWRHMHQITGFDLIKTNILVRQTLLSSRLASNRHVGRTVTDKTVIKRFLIKKACIKWKWLHHIPPFWDKSKIEMERNFFYWASYMSSCSTGWVLLKLLPYFALKNQRVWGRIQTPTGKRWDVCEVIVHFFIRNLGLR